MAELLVSAPAKINLHLEVLGLRPDGFHELAMVMQTIDLADTLRLQPTADGAIRLQCDRSDLPTDGSNLIVRAGELLRARVGLPELGAAITLEKRIPIGAGLAGGSSNGAAALVGLNALWGCGFSRPQLHAMAAELGSDMPFCLDGGTQLCFGRGEVLEPVGGRAEVAQAGDAAAAEPLGVLLVKHPESSVSTPWAYGRCRELRGDFYLSGEAEFAQRREALRRGPLLAALAGAAAWPPIRNDLQAVVEPEVASVREGLALLRRGGDALALAMSGSGPSLFALYPDQAAAEAARQRLAADLATGGFEAWSCRCTGSGVSLGA
ncbi:MAG: 4-(cytidine 5'-diphospho)-2-C-methyl-D-erythritol kinase [Synechococcus sp.]|nr:4-(cytidine 5'-diphospho)-2-C-methyl-D-erythritol kinase [Synechococcus sp.]